MYWEPCVPPVAKDEEKGEAVKEVEKCADLKNVRVAVEVGTKYVDLN